MVKDSVYADQSLQVFEPKHKSEFGPMLIGFQPRVSRVWPEGRYLDSLSDLANKYNAVLIVPNGGRDGEFENEEDYDFLARSVKALLVEFRLDPTRIFAVGLNEGADDAIQFCLKRPEVISGAILIDPTLSGQKHVFNFKENAVGKKFLFIHYFKNFPRNRMRPLVEMLQHNHANVRFEVVKPMTKKFSFGNTHSRFIEKLDWILEQDYWGIKAENEENEALNVFVYNVLSREIPMGGKLTIDLTSGRPGAMLIQIIDQDDRIRFEEVYYFVFGKRYVVITPPKLDQGHYILRLNCPLGVVEESFQVKG